MGAIQAQDYLGSLWGIGLRSKRSNESDVERAVEDGSIVRTWPMRGTLHFVPAGDVRWMLALLTPRILKRNAARLSREYGIDRSVLDRAKTILVRTLQGGRKLTREATYGVLASGGISASRQRGLHILWWLAQEGVVCFGPRVGKQQTFVLLDEWVPKADSIGRDEGVALLARRYFVSHGPASVRDFAWWSGLTLKEATQGIDAIRGQLSHRDSDGETLFWGEATDGKAGAVDGLHLLPAFDEYTVAYKNRESIIHPGYRRRGVVGFGINSPAIVVDGKVTGTWGRRISRTGVTVEPRKGTPLSKSDQQLFVGEAQRYSAFLDLTGSANTLPPKKSRDRSEK